MKQYLASLIGVLAIFQGIAHGASTAADYLGSWNITAYGDMNISSPGEIPVVIQPWETVVTISPPADTNHDLALNVTSGSNTLSTPLDISCPNCFAGLPERNIPWPGSWTDFGDHLIDVAVVTAGNAMATGIVGQQEGTTPSDTGFLYSVWQKESVAVTRDDFIGNWKVDAFYSDPNIRNLSEGFGLTGTDPLFFTIYEGSALDTLSIDIGTSDSNPWQFELQVAGAHAVLMDPFENSDGRLLTFDLVCGGERLAWAMIGQELDDLSDISLSIGSASPVPIPASAWLFISGLLSLIGFSKCGGALGSSKNK